MKRNFSVILILLAFLFSISIFSGFKKSEAFADEKSEVYSSAKSSYLIEPYTGTVIFSKNENERLPIASMCKIMTLLLSFEALDCKDISIDETICVSDTASGMGGSQVFLEAGGEYIVGDLIKSIVVASANDACVAMAERLCGSESSFVDKMNERAEQLEMNDTRFVNCTGLPMAGQYSSAKDVAKMFSELIKHDDYFRFSRIWTDKIMHPNDRFTEISNTNKLIRFYNGCDAGKTGYTSEAGHCLAASAIRNGMRLISVVISSPDSKSRFKEVSSMFNYGFSNYVNKLIIDDKKPLEINVEVKNGKKDSLEIIAEKPYYIFSKRNEKIAVELEFLPNDLVKAPIKLGDYVGKILVYQNGSEIAQIPVLANEEILQKTYFDIIKNVTEKWAII